MKTCSQKLEEQRKEHSKTEYGRSLIKCGIVAGPAIFSRFSTLGVVFGSQAFIGHNVILDQQSLLPMLWCRMFCLDTVKYRFGLSGVMVSTILAYWIPNISELIYLCGGWCPDTCKGFFVLAFKDHWPIIELSLSSGVMLCTILVLLTGSMKRADIAIDALLICLNINGWETMISLGFMAVASVKVSNELGRGSSRAAKFSTVQIVLTSFTIGFVLFMLFLFFRERLAYIFTESTIGSVTSIGVFHTAE